MTVAAFPLSWPHGYMSDKTVAELMALHRVAVEAAVALDVADSFGSGSTKEQLSALRADAAAAYAALEQAIRRAVDSAALSAEPAQPKALMDADELTDEQIESALKGAGINIGLDDGTPGYRFIMMAAFNAVVAADRASRLPEIKDEQIVSAMLAGSGGDPVWMRLTHKQMIAAGRAVEALVRGKT